MTRRATKALNPVMVENKPSNGDPPYNPPGRWTVLRCGLAGICIMAVACTIKFTSAIPRLFTDDWTWTEMALFPLQVIVLGFFPGIATGLLLPLRRFGRPGHATIGAGCANIYLLACFALFEFDALLNARLASVLAFSAIATFAGAAMGIVIAHDIRDGDRRASTSDRNMNE